MALTRAAQRAGLVAGCALAIAAGAFRFTASPGPGLDPDAMSYLGAARALAADGALRIPMAPWWGDSTTQPLAHFPPGYATVLAAPIALGADARLAARLVQGAAAGISTATVMLALWPAVGAWGAALGALAMVLSPAYVLVHLSVLSEPLFLALITLALWSFVGRPRAALMHGVIAAAATMVRYAGLSVAGAAALWALRDTTAPWRDRLRRAALAVAPSLLALAAWSLTRARAPGRAAPIRRVALYGGWGPTLDEGARSIAHLLAPSLDGQPVPWLAAGATLVAIAALSWSTVRTPDDATPEPAVALVAPVADPRHAEQHALLIASGLLALVYAGLVLAARALADPDIPFDFRLIVPLVPLAVASTTVIATRAWRVISRPSRVFGVLALAVWSVAALTADEIQVSYVLAEGGDFSESAWRDSPTLAWARGQDPARALYTNWPCALWFHLDRRIRDVPRTLDAATMHAFVARLRATNGAVVAWTAQSPETANTDSIVVRAGLVRVAAFADGGIFVAPSLAPQATPPVITTPRVPVAPAAAPR